jgi:hypothetical protein
MEGSDFVRKAISIMFVLLLLGGCAMYKHRSQIRDGLLTTGLNRNAFLKEWGMPDRTSTVSSDEFSSFSAGFSGSAGSAAYFSGREPLDVWIYEKLDVTLVFNGLRLVAWKTDKSREELKAISKQRQE